MRSEPEWANELSKLEVPSKVRSQISEHIRADGGISSRDLGALLDVRADVIRRQLRRKDNSSGYITKIPARTAYTVLKGYLPRVLGWKTVADFADELGIHRNTVESVVTQAGKKRALRYCFDQKIYISPSGEEFVRDRREALKGLESQELLTDFAKRMRVSLNRVTAFFSARKVTLESDIRGRARMSPENKETFLTWREGVLERRRHNDRVIDGVLHRSIVRLAEEKADILAQPGTASHRKILKREIGSFRHAARLGGFGKKTENGTYIPAERVPSLFPYLTIVQAARICDVSTKTITTWARQSPAIVIPNQAGNRRWGVSIERVVPLAQKKYSEVRSLLEREHVPTIVASFAIDRTATRLGGSFERVMQMLPLDTTAQNSLRKRVGMLPRDVSNRVTAIINGDVDQGLEIPVTREVLKAFASNARRLDISVGDLSVLALSVSAAQEMQIGSTLPCDQYMQFLRFGSMGLRHFNKEMVVPTVHLRGAVADWSKRNHIPVETLCFLASVGDDERRNLEAKSGYVTGATARKILRFARMTPDEFQRETAVSEDRFRAVIEQRATRLGMTFTQLLAALPISVKSEQSLRTRQGIIDVKDIVTLRELLAAPQDRLLHALVPSVPIYSCSQVVQLVQAAASRLNSKEPQQLYTYLLRHFNPGQMAPRGFHELLQRSDREAVFPVSWGVLLRWFANQTQGIFVSGVTKRAASVGDIYVNPDMGDFGPIVSLSSDEGGPVAQVALFGRKEMVSFRV
jgi:hypothetical protein